MRLLTPHRRPQPRSLAAALAAALLAPLGAALGLDAATDQARRADLELLVLGPGGTPLAEIPVEVELDRHEFLFGCNLYAFDRLGDPFRDQTYKRRFREVFNYATLPFYWKGYEPRRGAPGHERTERLLAWCEAWGITAKGHPLVWTHPAGVPPWIEGLEPARVRDLVAARVEEAVRRFQGRIALWDVVNEPVHTAPFPGFRDRLEEIATAYRTARAADPRARLVLNEYHVLSEVADFLPFARQCLEGEVPIDALGLQGHEPRGGHFRPERIREVLDRCAALGKEIHLTEVTFPADGGRVLAREPGGRWQETGEVRDEAWQARAFEDLYRTAFAHPAVAAITWWDLADSRSWLPGGGLLREDLSPKPAYEVLRRLVREEWHTRVRGRTDGSGRIAFRGFPGTYTARALETLPGATAAVSFRKDGPHSATARLRAPWRIDPAGAEAVFATGEPLAFTISGHGPPGRVLVPDPRSPPPPHPALEALGPGAARITLAELPPGPYTLEAEETEATRRARQSFAVLPAAAAGEPPAGGAVAADAALAWLAPDRSRALLELARRAGVRWIRERLSWSGVEPRPGEFHWGHYDRIAAEARAAGISVCQVFHDAPDWARGGRGAKSFPPDLRSAYRFARAAGAHFRGRIQAWEPWNEPDIPVFSSEPADQYAAFLKAAALGFRDADPSLLVLMGSLAMAPGPFAEAFLENETAGFFDAYNYHTYEPLAGYSQRARAHRDLRRRFGIAAKPVWVTEAGIRLESPGGALDPAQALAQARFLTASVATSVAEGTARHFFFILPFYHENTVQFGLLERDGSPGPGYCSLAALTWLAGDASRARPLTGLPGGLAGTVFERRDGRQAAVIWGGEERVEIQVPPELEARDLFGRLVLPALAAGSARPLAAGEDPVWLLAPFGAGAGSLPGRAVPGPEEAAGAAAPPGSDAGRAEIALTRAVLRFLFPLEHAEKGREAWRLPEGGGLAGKLQVYNFSGEPLEGEVRLAAPAGLSVEPQAAPVEVAPGELLELDLSVRLDGEEASRGEVLRVHAGLEGRLGELRGRASRAVARFARAGS